MDSRFGIRTEKPLRIYISGPYTAETESQVQRNVTKAVDIGLILLKRGHHPYVPHLTYYVDKRARETGIPVDWENYLEWDQAWIDVCDALLYLGDSKGAKRELEYARRIGKMIFVDLDDIPVVSNKEGELSELKESQIG